MRLEDFDFSLPADRIAQSPLENRSASRMLIVDRTAGSWRDASFSAILGETAKGDVLVLNNTKVFPARLGGRLATGAAIEIFLVQETEKDLWEALARPGRRLSPGKKVLIADDLTAEVIEKRDDGRVLIRLDASGADVSQVIDRVGSTPLPPYIRRSDGDEPADRERYQTVYAADRGAIAAPTAGLHFTDEILSEVRASGVEIVELTLHVGYGTFEPVRADVVEDHRVSPERCRLSEDAAERLNAALADGRRIVAVGTTSTRALESMLAGRDRFVAGDHVADLTILPGYRFRAVSALLTNFHLPKSSLLILTSTFGGHELIMDAYRHAVAAGYRFYSYGDCMLIK